MGLRRKVKQLIVEPKRLEVVRTIHVPHLTGQHFPGGPR
jgi:hypothetical protein